MFIATFVGVMGITNTLMISVWNRKREIGIIRAVGGTRRQIIKMVLLESVVISIVGIATAVVKGLFDTYFMTRTAATVFGGYSVPFYFPIALILVSVPVVIVLALAAAWRPARLASGTNVVAAIGSE
jgi:putative ABC transport system permease protein